MTLDADMPREAVEAYGRRVAEVRELAAAVEQDRARLGRTLR